MFQEDSDSPGPYIDPELNFGQDNADVYKSIRDRIPFVVREIEKEFFGTYMGKG